MGRSLVYYVVGSIIIMGLYFGAVFVGVHYGT